MEKKYRYKLNLWQVLIDFHKASIHRDSLYNIMYDFGFTSKHITCYMCIKNTSHYQVKTRNKL